MEDTQHAMLRCIVDMLRVEVYRSEDLASEFHADFLDAVKAFTYHLCMTRIPSSACTLSLLA